MSEFYYSGSIQMDRIGEKTREQFTKCFAGMRTVFLDDANSIIFEEHRDGPMLDDLNAINEAVKRDGRIILRAEITYYGDVDGAYVYNTSTKQFESMDQDEYVIFSADCETLQAELKRRQTVRPDTARWQEMLREYVENDLAAACPTRSA